MRIRAVLSLLPAMSLAAVVSAPAPAPADEIGLSPDGHRWSDELRRPLFDPGFRWVPGDAEVETFYVRNDGPSDATMTIEAVTEDRHGLVSDDHIDIAVRAGGGEWSTLGNGQDAATLVKDEMVLGGTTRVDVRVDFDPASTNASQSDVLPLELVVTLRQRGVLPEDEEPDGGGGDGNLPDTGSDLPVWLVWLGAALLGGGIALVAGRRRAEGPHG